MVRGRGAKLQDWQDVLALLDAADVDAIADAYGPDNYRHASVLASITLSIDDLPPADRDRYREFAVFAGRGSVPPAAVSALWASAGWSAADTGRLLDRSLAQRDDRGWITLHDLQYDVAAHQLSPSGLARAHGRLLDGYRFQLPQPLSVPSASGQQSPSVWVGGPDDGYLFQNLAFHLAAAELSEQLGGLLLLRMSVRALSAEAWLRQIRLYADTARTPSSTSSKPGEGVAPAAYDRVRTTSRTPATVRRTPSSYALSTKPARTRCSMSR
jgi:hypothetical protein